MSASDEEPLKLQSRLSAARHDDEAPANDAHEARSRDLAIMRATLESTADGILVTDNDERIAVCNGRYREMWGLTDMQVEGSAHRALNERISAAVDDPAGFLATIDEIRKGSGESRDVVYLLDGRTFQRYSRILSVGGQTTGRVWSYRDVTRRLHAEQALQDETRQLELMIESAHALASQREVRDVLQLVTNSATRLTRAEFGAFFFNTVDERGESLTLYTLAGAPPEAFSKFPLPRATALFGATFRGERVVRCDDVLTDASYGKSAPYFGMPPGLPVRSYLAVPVVSRSGAVHGGLFFGHSEVGVFTPRDELTVSSIATQAGVALDNSLLFEETVRVQKELHYLNESLEQRVAERGAELQKSEQQFQQLVAAVTDYAIYMLSPTGSIESWNPGAERIKGYTAEEIIGKHFSQFYTEEDRATGLPLRALQTAEKTGKFAGEGWRVRKDGTRFWANVLIDPVWDTQGKLIGFAKVTRDLTEQRAMQEQLHQAQKMEAIGQLTGGVAHDFNNLLTVIVGNLETIWRQTPTENGRLHRAIDQARRGAHRAATLTQQLLAFARRQPLNPKPTDVNRLVADMSEMLRRTLGESIAIETVLGGGLWRVHVDPHQLESALINLAVNARDAMPSGGRLTIETANAHLDESYAPGYAEISPGQYVVMCVTDTGTGMTRDVIDRAFEPFFTTKPIGQGTGLGLSQVYGFVKQSGGHVKLYSEVGQGTTVKIYLPRPHDLQVEDEQQRPAIAVHGHPNETVLVVEDDDDVRLYSTETLREFGFTVLQASTAMVALQMLEEHPEIKLLFTDVGLPGMNGRQLVDEVHKRRPGLKVLFTTGYARNAIVHQGRLDRGVELLTKPFTQAQLANRIREVLDLP